MHGRTLFLVASLVLPIIAAPTPADGVSELEALCSPATDRYHRSRVLGVAMRFPCLLFSQLLRKELRS